MKNLVILFSIVFTISLFSKESYDRLADLKSMISKEISSAKSQGKKETFSEVFMNNVDYEPELYSYFISQSYEVHSGFRYYHIIWK